ncbi:MAG: hypothetical protein AAGA58_18325 [Verrucomicrobiota bacterium]
MAATFLNVDLEIETPEPLDRACGGLLEAEAFKLYDGETKGGFLATFEVKDGLLNTDPNSIINTFCDIVAGFDERARRIWDRASRRTFDIGYETDDKDGSFHSELKNDVLARVAELSADVRLTLYPRPPEHQTNREQGDAGQRGSRSDSE